MQKSNKALNDCPLTIDGTTITTHHEDRVKEVHIVFVNSGGNCGPLVLMIFRERSLVLAEHGYRRGYEITGVSNESLTHA
jgi:hypothetical protein